MTLATDEIVNAARGELPALSQVIGAAFHGLAVSEYLIPSPEDRRALQPLHLHQVVEHAHHHGFVHTAPDRNAVAVWLPVFGTGTPPIPGYAERRAQILGPYTAAFAVFEDAMHGHHPVGRDHWHLALLAVAPGAQGQGLGSALLAYMHRVVDGSGQSVFVEASSERSRDLYLRHGYLACAGEPYPVGPGGPVMFPLWREPGAARRYRHGQPS